MSELRTEGLYPRSKEASPTIRRLALSILLQALRDVIGPVRKKGDTRFWRRDAIAWFADENYYPGGLLWVCDVLGREPGEIRAWLKQYKAVDREGRKELAEKVKRLQFVH